MRAWTIDPVLVGKPNQVRVLLSDELRLHPYLPGHLLTLAPLSWHRASLFPRG